MSAQLVFFLFLIPFSGAIAMPLLGQWRRAVCRPVAIGTLSVMFLCSMTAYRHVLEHGALHYMLGGWPAPFGIELVLDGLSGLLMIVLSLISLLSVVFSGPVLPENLGVRIVPYFTLVLLLVSALTGMTVTADLFNLFVFLEVASLCSYALVGVPGGRALVAAFRYLIMGTIGASFYLLGVAYFYAASGTLNMGDLAGRIPDLIHSKAVHTGLTFVFLGLAIKMALVPLHGWLPEAYTYAPHSVSPLLASLVTKVSLYAFVRVGFWVLGVGTANLQVPVLMLLGWAAALAAVVGAFLALIQPDLKRMFAYGGISHIGVILIGIASGNQTGFAGGVFYMINDAIMQASLFFLVGITAQRVGATELRHLTRLRGGMPVLIAALIVTAMSMIGIPPTGGFFAKWYILLGALEAKNYPAVVAVIGATLLTLAYFVRVIEKVFVEPEDADFKAGRSPRDTPGEMSWSLGILTVCIILLGVLSDTIVGLILHSALPPGLGGAA